MTKCRIPKSSIHVMPSSRSRAAPFVARTSTSSTSWPSAARFFRVLPKSLALTICRNACPWPKPAGHYHQLQVREPEKCIDAMGMESHVSVKHAESLMDRAKQMMLSENDSPHVLREMIYVCRPDGILYDTRGLQWIDRQVAFRHGNEQRAHLQNGSDRCEAMDGRPSTPDRRR